MILFELEEFAGRRRTTQADLEKRFIPVVRKALSIATDTSGWEDTLSEVKAAYREIYEAEFGQPAAPRKKFITSLQTALRKAHRSLTPEPPQVEALAELLATSVLGEVTIEMAKADEHDLLLEWVDMDDDRVRKTHKEAGGQRRPVGEKFKVGGYEMSRPGDTTVPPELWIRCRCTLRPVRAQEALVAAADKKNTSTVVVALPAADHPVHEMGEEQKHITCHASAVRRQHRPSSPPRLWWHRPCATPARPPASTTTPRTGSASATATTRSAVRPGSQPGSSVMRCRD